MVFKIMSKNQVDVRIKGVRLFSVLIFLSAAIAIYFRWVENADAYAIFKPLTTILIISMAVFIYSKKPTKYRVFLIPALVLSLIGDVFLIGDDYFLYGLSAFFMAHIVLIIAFTRIAGVLHNYHVLMVLSSIGIGYYLFLFPQLGDYRLPVALYIMVLLAMSWQALSLAMLYKSKRLIALALASLLFSFSDGVLVYSKFIETFDFLGVLILSTYWLAIFIFTIVGADNNLNQE